MGKNKKQPIPVQTSKKKMNLKWEDLIEAKDMPVKALISQQLQLKALIEKHKDDITPELSQVIGGLSGTYTDVANAIRLTMDKHITMDENDVIVDYKKGAIKDGSDDFFAYLGIAREYISQAENIATYASTAFTDIFTQLKVYDAKKFKEAMAESSEDMNKIKMEAIHGN